MHANILQWHLKQTDPSSMHGTHHSQQVLRRLISVNYHYNKINPHIAVDFMQPNLLQESSESIGK